MVGVHLPSLLTLPAEILTQIFSYVYSEWHLNDTYPSYPHLTPSHNDTQNLRLLNLTETPFRTGPTPGTICKALTPIITRAIYSSFTGHVHISRYNTVESFPRSWIPFSSLITSLSIDLRSDCKYVKLYEIEKMFSWLPGLRNVRFFQHEYICTQLGPAWARGVDRGVLEGFVEEMHRDDYDAVGKGKTQEGENHDGDTSDAAMTDLREEFRSFMVRSLCYGVMQGLKYLSKVPRSVNITWTRCHRVSTCTERYYILDYEILDRDNLGEAASIIEEEEIERRWKLRRIRHFDVKFV